MRTRSPHRLTRELPFQSGITVLENMESDYGTVIDFFFGIHNTNSEVTIQYRPIRIHIDISEDNLRNSDIIRDQYVRFIEAANGDESDGLTVDDFYDWILANCGPAFSQLTRQPSSFEPDLG